MKNLLILILLASPFLSSHLIAQKCKPITGEDKFTHRKEIWYGETLEETLMFSDRNTVIAMYIGTVNDSMCAFFTIKKILDKDAQFDINDTKEDFKIDKGQSIYLLTKSGESIRLYSLNKCVVSKKKVLSAYVISLMGSYTISKEQLKKLAESEITDYKIELSETLPLQRKVKSSRGQKLLKQFQCADSELVIKGCFALLPDDKN